MNSKGSYKRALYIIVTTPVVGIGADNPNACFIVNLRSTSTIRCLIQGSARTARFERFCPSASSGILQSTRNLNPDLLKLHLFIATAADDI
jgi:superfamily II DNA or RNA helicase